MNRLWRSLVLVVLCIALVVLAGCGNEPETQSPTQEITRPEGAAVGESVDVGEGLTVTLVTSDTSAEEGAVESPTVGAHWMVFDVLNTGETSATVASRPRRPSVTDASGATVAVPAMRVSLINGGGGMGLSAATLGPPYLNPGGRMRALFSVPGQTSAARPLVVRYPAGPGEAVFVVE